MCGEWWHIYSDNLPLLISLGTGLRLSLIRDSYINHFGWAVPADPVNETYLHGPRRKRLVAKIEHTPRYTTANTRKLLINAYVTGNELEDTDVISPEVI